TYRTPETAVRGFMHLVRWQQSRTQLMQTPPSIPETFHPDKAAAERIIDAVQAAGRKLLTTPEARGVFAAYGIPLPPERMVRDPAGAAHAAAELGQPVVLKILSPDITHKSDVGGVVLGLKTPAEVTAAAERMLARVAAARPEARIEGFTVEAM